MTVIFLKGIIVAEVLIFTVFTIFQISLLGFFHPYKAISENYVRLAHETVTLSICDLLLVSSIPIDPEARTEIGWGIIGILSLSILVSQGMLFKESFRNIKLKCRKRAYEKY